MKDIFIDANIASKFATTPNAHYQELINWLLFEDKATPANNAFLLVSNYLRKEYFDGNQNCNKQFSIVNIFNKLLAQGRINPKSKNELETFKQQNISKKQWDKLDSKANDKDHIPLVFLSNRKCVLSSDNAFLSDLINFPKLGKLIVYAKEPQDLNYK